MTIGSQTSRWRRGVAAASRWPDATASSSALPIDRLGQRVLAPIAQTGPRRLGRYRRHVAPAALAFHAARAFDGDARPRLAMRLDIEGRLAQLHLRYDEEHR